MKKTKIDWCDSTINPVVGCSRNCPYCYARIMCKRFGNKWGVNDFSKPVFFPERLKQFESKKPKSIFINSMSDVAYWNSEWFDAVIQAIEENPQHKYITLSKSVDGYFCPPHLRPSYVYSGYTATTQYQLDDLQKDYNYISETGFDFLNIEPILEPISLEWITDPHIEMVIIGAETGNRKGKVIPQKEWIDDIVRQADERGIRVFMKESLKELMGTDFRQDELIWGIKR